MTITSGNRGCFRRFRGRAFLPRSGPCSRSDFSFSIEGREGIVDAGELSGKGAFGNLPCGEGFIAPVEGTAEGVLVVDGSIAAIGLVSSPVQLTVEGASLVGACMERRLLINCTQGTVLRILPAMNLTVEQAHEGLDILGKVLQQVASSK